jgi:hypothetical protein
MLLQQAGLAEETQADRATLSAVALVLKIVASNG